MTNFEKVGLFMKTFGQEVKSKPDFATDKINELRVNLIVEELEELKEKVLKPKKTHKQLIDEVDFIDD